MTAIDGGEVARSLNHRRNIEAFLDALSTGESYPLDAVEVRKAVALIETIYESADSGSPVHLS